MGCTYQYNFPTALKVSFGMSIAPQAITAPYIPHSGRGRRAAYDDRGNDEQVSLYVY